MATTDAKAFVDTNVLLRATISQFPLHEQAKRLINSQIDADIELWISRQVIREYISQATRPQSFMKPMTIERVETQLNTIRAFFKIADETEQVTVELMKLLKTFPTGGKQIHDANIIATMLTQDINKLLTTNIEDMKRFNSRITLIPLI